MVRLCDDRLEGGRKLALEARWREWKKGDEGKRMPMVVGCFKAQSWERKDGGDDEAKFSGVGGGRNVDEGG